MASLFVRRVFSVFSDSIQNTGSVEQVCHTVRYNNVLGTKFRNALVAGKPTICDGLGLKLCNDTAIKVRPKEQITLMTPV